jgi:separase
MLNPSGDLPNTETIFRPLLKTLPPSWTHTCRAPNESGFSDMLANEDLFLYFGHGSGAQFIRARTVRKLPQAPTTWLMGCSSGAVTDNGEYEPSGMILSYLTAGAPAVVGTLWDVTDKDCDRASLKAGELWGLWEPAETPKSLVIKGKAKKNMEMEQSRGSRAAGKRPVGRDRSRIVSRSDGGDLARSSVVEAVRRSRDECYLRYLNGAALVIYGIPVFLDD